MDYLNLNGLGGAQQSAMCTPLGDTEVSREKKVRINIVPATESNRHNTGGGGHVDVYAGRQHRRTGSLPDGMGVPPGHMQPSV